MAKNSTQYVCQDCAAVSSKWSGRCDNCGAWNTLVEEAGSEQAPKGLGSKRGRHVEFVGLEGDSPPPMRMVTGIAEFDRVCGGGLVPGSALLVGGDPGIGKSTVLLQAAASLAKNASIAYISGEESIEQLRMRADRLGFRKATVKLAAATSVRDIVTTLNSGEPPKVVIVDSIQTMFVDSLDSAPGTVSQVRTSAQELIRLAKRRGFCVILVGHVTKDGQIAGPRVMEHMVDTVLYFEGERSHQFRILRAVKNRFGPTDEIGVFEMTGTGLMEVSNPSALFLSDHDSEINGASVLAAMEGTRPMLVELQSLIAPSPLGTPRRAVVGWDSGRLAMVLAVLESRCGLAIGANDVYLNVAGGLRVSEPAADLAVAAALASSLSGIAVPPQTVVFGEIGLSGEVRAVSHTDARLKEADKLGFTRAIVPKGRGKGKGIKGPSGMEIREIEHLADLLALFHAPAKGTVLKEQANG
ncbi:MAG: DNA repair protein RadA [Rhodospirillaceae bacterium]|nr:DNA repair protein RadA [Rhodospirillaceae bacterium]MBL6940604.1 DNA repair protein RadA [Rhodospirillales bacterium]